MWWTRECIAVVWWSAVLASASALHFDLYLIRTVAPALLWLAHYRIAFIFAAAVLFALIWGEGWFRQGLLYVLLYPFVVVLWHFPRAAIRHWVLAIAFYPAVDWMVVRFWETTFWIALVVNAVFVIAAFESPYLIYGAMLVLAGFLARLYWLDFHKSFMPSAVLVNLALLLRKVWFLADQHFLATSQKALATLNPDSREYQTRHRAVLQSAFCLNGGLQWLAAELWSVSQRHALLVYLAGATTFSLVSTVIVFAFEYLALYRLDEAHFGNVPDPGVGAFMSYSLATLTNTSWSALHARSAAAQAIGHVEVVCGCLILGHGVLAIIMLRRQRNTNDLERVAVELGATAAAISSQMTGKGQLRVDDIEDVLLQESARLVNQMRRVQELVDDGALADAPRTNEVALES